MTVRREPPILAFTIPEAANAIRLSENTLRIWVKEGIVRTVRWQSTDFVPRVELDRLIDVAMNNGGVLPALASATDSSGPATAVESVADGAASPRDNCSALGEVRVATVGPSSPQLPGRSTHAKQKAPARTGALQDNAG